MEGRRVMALTSAEHRQLQTAKRVARNEHSRDNRAAGGPVYRKVPVHVTIITTVDQDGAPLTLATSDAPAERGRFFTLTPEGNRWRCACATFRQLGGCAHVGHLASTAGTDRGTG